MKRILLLSFVFLLLTVQAQKKIYHTNRFETASPKIDGIISEAAWDVVVWDGDFIQWEPANGALPSQRTQFKIIYDDNYLYVAIRAFDSVPGEIVKRMSRRDGFEGDFVEVSFDSYHDFLTAYSFTATVAGVKGDEKITSDGENWDDTWDPIWYMKTSVDSLGWIAEMKIPLTQLRFSKESKQLWGLEVKRKIYRKEERSLWQHIDNTESGYVSRFGELHGLENLNPKRQLDVTPYLVGSYEHYKEEEGSPFYTGSDLHARAGVDAKIGLTNNITMDLSINPDFGQVEADPSEVNLTAFESYFDEQRPFFIEGRNIFQFSLQPGDGDMSNNGLFYSRRIGRSPQYYPGEYDHVRMPENTKILGAAKISGKTKKGLSIGIMESVTNSEKADVMNEGEAEMSTVVEPMTNYFVGTVEQEINEGNTLIGGMLTSTNRLIKDDYLHALPTNAYSGGVNFSHSWKDRKYNISFKLLGSTVNGDSAAMMNLQTSSRRYYQRPDAKKVRLDSNMRTLSGHGGFLSFGKSTGSGWNYMGWFSWISPGLELNDVGYLRSADDMNQVLWVGYSSPQPVGILRRYNVGLAQWNSWNFDGVHQDFGLNLNMNLRFTNYWSFGVGSNLNAQSHSVNLLRGGPIFIVPLSGNYWSHIGSDYRKKLSFDTFFSQSFGKFSYRKRTGFGLGLIYRPSDRLKLSVEPSWSVNSNKIQYVDTQNFQGQDEYFLAEIDQQTFVVEFRIDYSFTPDLSLQFYGQPFVSTGKYDHFKRVTNSTASNFEDRYDIVKLDEDRGVDLNNDGQTDVYMPNPDFKFIYFQS
ncbi:MAG: carbohydrate binding family 9 domain-containing protein, partial [Bacteroidales bacterium]|nr:carbohydrate binding family 9 domain-containing protein [Bacteroidales bacterium]